jgi:hypothetical protein
LLMKKRENNPIKGVYRNQGEGVENEGFDN